MQCKSYKVTDRLVVYSWTKNQQGFFFQEQWIRGWSCSLRELGKVRVQIGPVGFQQNKLSVYLEQFLKLRATRKWTLFRHSESYTIRTGLRSTDFVEKSISKWKFAQMFKKWIIPKKSTVSFIIIKNNQFNYLSDFKV